MFLVGKVNERFKRFFATELRPCHLCARLKESINKTAETVSDFSGVSDKSPDDVTVPTPPCYKVDLGISMG